MKKIIIFIVLIMSSNVFAECDIDTQIKALRVKLIEYQGAKDHAWDRYKANCFYIYVNSCWVCSTEVRMINSDNTMPVSEDLCPKIKCVMGDLTGGVVSFLSACTGIGIPILGLLGESCSDWCSEWHAQDNLIEQTNVSIAELQKVREKAGCGPPSKCETDPNPLKCNCTENGKTWSTNANICCEDSGNVAQCTCEADMKHKWNYTSNTCEPIGSGTKTTTTSKTTSTSNYNTETTSTTGGTTSTDGSTTTSTKSNTTPRGSGLVAVSDKAPSGSSYGNKSGANWYDDVAEMYDPGTKSSNNSQANTSNNAGATVVVGDDNKGNANKKATEIKADNTDIFKLVTSMYQKRYYAGLIGENIKAVTTRTSIKTGKKPVVYK